jgi:hypothetical protein
MPGDSTYLANKLNDHGNGVASFTEPTPYVALIRLSAGQSPRSTAVTSAQTTMPATPNGHMYRCSTAGTTGSGEPTWPTTSGGTVTDGTAVWTEMTPDFQANNSSVTGSEATYGGYARVALSGLMGASSAGSASNSSVINMPSWTSGANNTIGGWMTYDTATVGNLLKFAVVSTGTTATVVTSGNPTPSFAIGALVTTQG